MKIEQRNLVRRLANKAAKALREYNALPYSCGVDLISDEQRQFYLGTYIAYRNAAIDAARSLQ